MCPQRLPGHIQRCADCRAHLGCGGEHSPEARTGAPGVRCLAPGSRQVRSAQRALRDRPACSRDRRLEVGGGCKQRGAARVRPGDLPALRVAGAVGRRAGSSPPELHSYGRPRGSGTRQAGEGRALARPVFPDHSYSEWRRPGGGTGRRAGLKIPWDVSPLWVRLPPRAFSPRAVRTPPQSVGCRAAS